MFAAMMVMTRLAAIFAAMVAWGGQVLTVAPEAAAPIDAAQPETALAGDDEITTSDELLRALETAGNDVRQLSAEVSYVKMFAIQGDTQKRDGTLTFVSTPSEESETPDAGVSHDRRFAIVFTRLELDNGRRVEDESTGYLERYVFDGEWLAEVRPFDKQFIRRQVVAPGDKWDPLRLGEGPFPIPIQQKRADILARFDAELLDGLDGVEERALRGAAGKCYQLRLIPKAEANEKELREIRVWYQRDTLLPRMAKTISQADDEAYVLLRNVETNDDAQVSEAELTTAPPKDTTGWNITVEPYAG